MDEKVYPDEEFQLPWRAFWDLDGTRTSGFGTPNPINFTDIAAWMDLHSITGVEHRPFFAGLIRHLDRIRLEDLMQKADKDK